MKTFEVIFAKQVKVLGYNKDIPILAKQTIISDTSDKLNIPVPQGFAIVNIMEILPTINLCTDEKKN